MKNKNKLKNISSWEHLVFQIGSSELQALCTVNNTTIWRWSFKGIPIKYWKLLIAKYGLTFEQLKKLKTAE